MMGFISSLLERRSGADYDGYYVDADPSLLSYLIPSSSGITVTEDIALTYSAHYACVKVIAETVAMIPIHIYKRLKPSGKERAPDHYLYQILHEEPNPNMTAFQYKSTVMVHLLTWGNHYSSIIWADRMKTRVKELWPLNPARMHMKTVDGQTWYIYRLPNGEKRKIRPKDIFHIPALSTNGLKGMSPVSQMREAIGLGLAHEKFGNKFYQNSTHVGSWIEYEQKLGDPAKKNLRESINNMHQGLDCSHRILILERGMKYHQIGMPLKDAQFLESRKFSLEEMCRIHRLQLHKVASMEHASKRNIEHQNIEFKTDTIQPWATCIEQEIKRQLFMDKDKPIFFPAFLLDALVRGDIESRWKAYEVGRSIAVLSANEIREREDMNPQIGLDGSLNPAGNEYYYQNIWTKQGAPAMTAPSQTEPTQEVKMVKIPVETRQQGSIERKRLRGIFKPLILDAAEKIVRLEVNDIRRAIDRYLGKRNREGFDKWLDGFYKKFPEKVSRHMRPILDSYGNAVIDAARRQVDGPEPDEEAAREFVDGYLKRFTDEHIRSSRGQLKAVMDKRDMSIDEELNERLDEWEEKRPGKIADREHIEASDAFAKYAWVLAGVTSLMWVAWGANPCPYCLELNGQIVGIDAYFVNDGDELNPVGGNGPMIIYGPRGHAPLHAGCDCSVEPA
jgi:HK97 family phage portal protein